MSASERRQRHRAELRARILEAALELVSAQGLGALSIRAIAERIEYSSAAIYLYFDNKEVLLHEVAREGFRRLDDALEAATVGAAAAAEPHAKLRALGQAYIGFALENTAYFRVMFDLPAVARLAHAGSCESPDAPPGSPGWAHTEAALELLVARGRLDPEIREVAGLSAWALLHGLASLYLGGHLSGAAPDHDAFRKLVDRVMHGHALRFSAVRTP